MIGRVAPLTPWAADALTDDDWAEIGAGPDLLVSLGYSGGWTCRLYPGPHERALVEVFGVPSAIDAYRAALRQLPETATFRGVEVDVA